MTILDLCDLLVGVIVLLEAWRGTLAQDLRLMDRGNVDWRCNSGDGQTSQNHDALEEHDDKRVLYGVDLTFIFSRLIGQDVVSRWFCDTNVSPEARSLPIDKTVATTAWNGAVCGHDRQSIGAVEPQRCSIVQPAKRAISSRFHAFTAVNGWPMLHVDMCLRPYIIHQPTVPLARAIIAL